MGLKNWLSRSDSSESSDDEYPVVEREETRVVRAFSEKRAKIHYTSGEEETVTYVERTDNDDSVTFVDWEDFYPSILSYFTDGSKKMPYMKHRTVDVLEPMKHAIEKIEPLGVWAEYVAYTDVVLEITTKPRTYSDTLVTKTEIVEQEDVTIMDRVEYEAMKERENDE